MIEGAEHMSDASMPQACGVSPVAERHTLRKGEKLRHKSLVDPLFREGKSLFEFPLRIVWRVLSPAELENSFRGVTPDRIDKLQMLITVPKKKRRHAVDRVLMRRRIREAYRLNRKQILGEIASSASTGTLSMALIYMHTDNLPYSTVERKLKVLLRKVAAKVSAAVQPEDGGAVSEEKK